MHIKFHYILCNVMLYLKIRLYDITLHSDLRDSERYIILYWISLYCVVLYHVFSFAM